MHPYIIPLPTLEATLYILYGVADLDDAAREYRATLARTYHDRTGRYFAARFY
jgi:hypothetical protein